MLVAAHCASLGLAGAPVRAPVMRRTAGPRSPAPLCRAHVSVELLRNSWGTRFTNFLENPAPPPGTLILLRHGASEAVGRYAHAHPALDDGQDFAIADAQGIQLQ